MLNFLTEDCKIGIYMLSYTLIKLSDKENNESLLD
jgi:hypothetical protein